MSTCTTSAIAEHDLKIAIDVGLIGNPWQFKNPDGTYQTLTGQRFIIRFYRAESDTEELATWDTQDAAPLIQIDTSSTPHVLRWLATPAQWSAQVGRYYRLTRIDANGNAQPLVKGRVLWV
ncbi:MAG: hypothetical protein N2045_13670 [Fimbriimonadales bacterium]|nr:hypothetical protein [Fimbriimonadales bacterium]